MKITAGIVTFNPELDRLKDNIEAIIGQVEEVLIVDNASKNISEIESLVNKYTTVRIKKFNKNLGIAKALNEIGCFAQKENYGWFLTLDQDSISMPDLIDAYRPYMHQEYLGQLTCKIIERGTDSVGYEMDRHMKISEVDDAITSGSLVKTEVFTKVGGFDEGLFIDAVDTDFNYRLIQNQYKTIRVNHIGILHELGKTKQVRFLGKEYTIVSHNSMRYYYIFRNEIILFRRYSNFFTTYRKIYMIKYLRKILILDDNKFKNFIAIFRGLIDGLTYKI